MSLTRSDVAKGRRVELSTFIGWGEDLTSVFRVKEEFDQVTNKAYVIHVVCNVCSKIWMPSNSTRLAKGKQGEICCPMS